MPRDEAEINRTKEILQALFKQAKAAERSSRRQGLRTPAFASLERKEAALHPASALILGLISNLNVILDEAQKGRLFRALSQDDRRTLAGFTYKLGSCSVAAAKYRGAEEQATLESLFAFAAGYRPSVLDRGLDDAVGGFTAEDYWTDARDMVDTLRSGLGGFVDVMTTVPVVGPTVRCVAAPPARSAGGARPKNRDCSRFCVSRCPPHQCTRCVV